jgi:multiple sugar transport system permease protein
MVLVAINQPFTIWMLRSFFQDIPESLEESAMVDGCSRFQAFWYVIVPIMGPGIVTASIFSLLLAYNEFLIPLVLTATNAVPLPVAISQFNAEDIQYWSIAAAGAVSITLPILIVVFLLQRYLIKGLTAGAVKG